MKAPVVVAFDPGTTQVGYAVATRDDDGRLKIAALERLEARVGTLRGVIAAAGPDAVVGIEVLPGFLAAKARADALFHTAHVAGLIEGCAAGHRVYHLPANGAGMRSSWRGYLTQNPRAADDAVKRALELHYPELKSRRSSVHVRDALGLATVLLLLHESAYGRKALEGMATPHG